MKRNVIYFIILSSFVLLACSERNEQSQEKNEVKIENPIESLKRTFKIVKLDSLDQAVSDSTSQQAKGDSGVIDSAIEFSSKSASKGIVTFGKIVYTALFLLFTYLILLGVTKVLNALSEYSTNYRIFFKRMIPIVRISVWSFAIYLIVAVIFSPPYETVIAFFASVGVAIGFASQDILKNIFGGLVILFDRPFQVGDKIDMGGHYGEVVEIGLRSIRILTADDSVVTIPNAVIMNNSVSNSNTGETNCLVETEIFLPLEVDMKEARSVAQEASYVSKNIFLKKPVSILFFNEFKDRKSLIKMVIKAYVSDPRNELALKSEITELVVSELLNRKVAGFG